MGMRHSWVCRALDDMAIRGLVEEGLLGAALTGLYGLSRAVPGVGGLALLAGLVGWTVAGAGGALVMPLALILPSCVAVFAAVPPWLARPGAPGKATLARAVGPVSVGQGFAGGIALLQFAHGGRIGLAVAGGAFVARLAGLPTLVILGAGGTAVAVAVML